MRERYKINRIKDNRKYYGSTFDYGITLHTIMLYSSCHLLSRCIGYKNEKAIAFDDK